LTLDADCEIAPEALRAAMARALAPEDGVPRALVSALPDVDCGDLASRMMMPAFGVWLALAMPMHEVNDARKRTALAAGGFLLVDRQALDAIGGYERLAPHIVEDVLTARLVKSTGRRIELFIGGRCLSTRMYVGWSELWEGITKNAFAAVDFRPAIAASALAVILTFAVLPSAVLAAWAVATVAGIPIPILTPVALALFGAAAAILAALHAAIALELRFSPAFGLLAAPAHLVFAAALATSALRATRGAGVSWKGRRYYGAGVASPSDKLLT
jgi:chlorobactene glucosyltransferase